MVTQVTFTREIQFLKLKKKMLEMGVGAHTCNLTSREKKAEKFHVGGQPMICGMILSKKNKVGILNSYSIFSKSIPATYLYLFFIHSVLMSTKPECY